jgi:hypothetical protein
VIVEAVIYSANVSRDDETFEFLIWLLAHFLPANGNRWIDYRSGEHFFVSAPPDEELTIAADLLFSLLP